ncbi:hypothetical protein C7H11_11405 [Escherichia coli]|nr:hypothetical protein C7H11_11405 [Escherichia coli]
MLRIPQNIIRLQPFHKLHLQMSDYVQHLGCSSSALSGPHRSHQVMFRLSSTFHHQNNLFYFNKIVQYT